MGQDRPHFPHVFVKRSIVLQVLKAATVPYGPRVIVTLAQFYWVSEPKQGRPWSVLGREITKTFSAEVNDGKASLNTSGLDNPMGSL